MEVEQRQRFTIQFLYIPSEAIVHKIYRADSAHEIIVEE